MSVSAVGLLFTLATLVALDSSRAGLRDQSRRIAFVHDGSLFATADSIPAPRPVALGLRGQSPTWSSDGVLAFARDCKIYVAREANVVPLTSPRGRQCDGEPTWSPGGDQIAFTRIISSERGRRASAIYVMGRDGSREVRLTQRMFDATSSRRPGYADSAPAWRPATGQQLAFTRASAGTTVRRLYLLDSRSRSVRRLPRQEPSFSYEEPSWSPDGDWLAVGRRGVRSGISSIFALRIDGTLVRNYDRRGKDPDWSPNGRAIAFVSLPSKHLIVMSAGPGLDPRVLASVQASEPAWEP